MSFALALNIPTHAARVLFTTTLVIAILSVLFLGGTAPLFIKFLKIKIEEPDSEEKEGDEEVGFSENSWYEYSVSVITFLISKVYYFRQEVFISVPYR
jgi:hypothetical protein